MKFTDLFRNLVFPHLWLDKQIAPAIIAAGIGAAGSVLGGAASGGLFGGGSDAPSIGDTLFGSALAKKNLLFGREKLGLPAFTPSTPFSALDPATGVTNIDPLARELGLGAFDEFSGSLGDTRSALLGNQNAFEQARVDPLLQQLSIGRAGRERELSRTGVRGTFRNRDLLDFDLAAQRELGNARSIAAQDTIGAVNAIDTLLFNAGTGTGLNVFNQELQALGLGIDTVNAINSLAQGLGTSASQIAAGGVANQALIDQRQLENVTAGLGAGFSTLSDSFGTTFGDNPGGLTSFGTATASNPNPLGLTL